MVDWHERVLTASCCIGSQEREGDDAELEALKLVKQLQQDGQIQAFGRGRQLPKRIYGLDELRMNKVEPEMLLSPKDTTILGVRNIMQARWSPARVAHRRGV